MTVTGPVRLERPFHWGVLLVADSETDNIPGASPDGFSSSSGAIAIAVRHAQDVEIDVSLSPDDPVPPFVVRVSADPGPSAALADFSGTIDVRSGSLSIGDAEDEVLVELDPGRYLIEVAVAPADHPESVRIWWSAVE